MKRFPWSKTGGLFLGLLSVCILLSAQSQKLESPFNHLKPKGPTENGSYSFWVGGHLYGSDRNDNHTWPARNFLANIPFLNQSEADFFVGMGDIFAEGTDSLVVENFLSVTDRLGMPFYNTPGNHDLRYYLYYRQQFGPGQWSFSYGPDLFISLDSERMVSHQHDPVQHIFGQLKYLRAIQSRIADAPPRHTFVFMHKLLWAKAYPETAFMLEYTNENYDTLSDPDSLQMMRTLLEDIAKKGTLTWFSGDIGVGTSLPFYFHPNPAKNLTFIACGITNSPDDVLLKLTVNEAGEIQYDLHSLTGDSLVSLTNSGPDAWKKLPKRPQPLEISQDSEIRKMLDHHYFWNGVVVCFIGMVLVIGIFWGVVRYKRTK